ncbi:MAG: tRNA (N6-threonylcarbamoyladenosine(37)-N6)-methyltransferase TrmO, partial [Zetaproteobacteria bacterium CG23_combo_of_CG06-09_8_20_14_all_54_7]
LLIRQILSQDPRPAYYGKNDGERVFGMKLLDYDVKWQTDGAIVLVTD